MGKGRSKDAPILAEPRVWSRLHAAPAWSRLHTDPEPAAAAVPSHYEARSHWKMALHGMTLAIHAMQRIVDPHTIRLLLEHGAPIEPRYE